MNVPQTNNTREALAVLEVLKMVPKEQSIKIMSDSKLVIENLTKHLKRHEDDGWIGVANKDLMKAVATEMREGKA